MISALPATQADVDFCAEIEKASFSEPWSVYSFSKAVDDTDTLFYVAKNENSVLGYFVAGNICNEINLYTIAVRDDCRGYGIGHALLKTLKQQAVLSDALAVFLEVRESNQAAIALYKNNGFIEIGKRKAFYKKPTEDALLFALYLKEEII